MARWSMTLGLAASVGGLAARGGCKAEPEPVRAGPSAEEVASVLARDPAFAQAVASALAASGAAPPPRVVPAGPLPEGEECKAATALAAGGNTALAVSHYRSCSGPERAAALAAIDASAERAVTLKGCAAKGDAQAAATIGAARAMQALRDKSCP